MPRAGRLLKKHIERWFEDATKSLDPGQYKYGGHLFTCACGAPSWQQPCPFCGYYPMGNDAQEFARVKGTTSKARFIQTVRAHGGLIPMWVADKKKTVAYTSDYQYKDAIDRALAKAKRQGDRFTPEQVWDTFSEPPPDPQGSFRFTRRSGS